MHPGGFEPPTARFVAEYSIQLSYGCIGKAILLRGYSPGTYDGFANQITTMLLLLRRIWCIREDYSAAPRPTAVAYATLSSLVLAIISQTIKQHRRCYQGEYGASGRIRTSDRSVRSRVLYPAELRMHRDYCCNSDIKFRDLPFLLKNGASGRIRTSDRSVRSRVLYPAELRMHRETCFTTRQCHN